MMTIRISGRKHLTDKRKDGPLHYMGMTIAIFRIKGMMDLIHHGDVLILMELH